MRTDPMTSRAKTPALEELLRSWGLHRAPEALADLPRSPFFMKITTFLHDLAAEENF
jgi:hypothetical protein